MTSAMRRLAMLLLAFACTALAAPMIASAQVPPPSLTTTINPPPANQPFEAFFHVFASPESDGFGPSARINVVDNVIFIQFFGLCEEPCAPPSYSAFPFTMPALPAGDYQVRFYFPMTSPPIFYPTLGLTVGGGFVTPVAVPSASTRWLTALAFLLAIAGTYLTPRRYIRPNS